MKTLTLTLILTALTVSIGFGQTQDQTNLHRYVVNLIATDINGYVDKTDTTNNTIMTYVKPPSFYDFDLVRSSISRWARQYSDVTVEVNWYRLDDDSFVAGYDVADVKFAIFYYPKTNTIVIASFLE